MGLDMYLYGYISNVEADGAQIVFGDERSRLNAIARGKREELAYWRKHWLLHDFLMGTGECWEAWEMVLSPDSIDAILAVLIKADDNRDYSIDAKTGDKQSEEEEEEEAWTALRDIRAFAKARVWLLAQETGSIRTVVYRNSW